MAYDGTFCLEWEFAGEIHKETIGLESSKFVWGLLSRHTNVMFPAHRAHGCQQTGGDVDIQRMREWITPVKWWQTRSSIWFIFYWHRSTLYRWVTHHSGVKLTEMLTLLYTEMDTIWGGIKKINRLSEYWTQSESHLFDTFAGVFFTDLQVGTSRNFSPFQPQPGFCSRCGAQIWWGASSRLNSRGMVAVRIVGDVFIHRCHPRITKSGDNIFSLLYRK